MIGHAINRGPIIRALQALDAQRQEAFDFARHNLSEFIRAEAQSIMNQYGVRMVAWEGAPETYSDLCLMWELYNGSCIEVSNQHCERTIYSTPEVNHLFRFWHDWLHLQHGKAFDLSGELYIGALHCEAVASFYGKHSLEHKLMIADTIGQSTYEAVAGKFPDDQRAFAWQFVFK